ncbi:hypothetical protein L218DRAFT_878852 [Marasmius fiardii PR-910]|nr:hypothetical protein L218DRAFT_878852 [Marasmius fiardii PR-910]
MLGFSTVMFSLATIHVALVGYHLILQASTEQTSGPLDIVKEIVLRTGVSTWWMIAYTVTYVTQELLGSAAAIYRTWLLWEHDWRVTVIPSVLMLSAIGEGVITYRLRYLITKFSSVVIGVGYVPTALFYILPPLQLFTDRRIPGLVTTFYILTVAMNIMSTSLLVYPIWSTHRKIPRPNSRLASQIQHATQSHSVLPRVMRIVIESAMLQLVVEGILLVTFITRSEAQYILLGLVVPIVVRFLLSLAIPNAGSNFNVPLRHKPKNRRLICDPLYFS